MSELFVDFKDLPDWCKEILKDMHRRPTSINVEVGTEHNVGGANMTTLYLFDGHEVRGTSWIVLSGASQAGPWESDIANSIALGAKVPIPRPECMILETRTLMGGIFVTLYVHPDSMVKALTAADTDLTVIHKAILYATRSYKSSYAGIKDYRFDEVGRAFEIAKGDWIKAKGELMETRHLTKRGAITTKGRNAIGDLDRRDIAKLFRITGEE